VEHGGYTWRTLDGADPAGGDEEECTYLSCFYGCQCTPRSGIGDWTWIYGDLDTCPSNHLPLPGGWVLAPNDATSIDVIATNHWSTDCSILADGTGWNTARIGSAAGEPCGGSSGYSTELHEDCDENGNWVYGPMGWFNVWVLPTLATSGDTYTVTACNSRVLIRCG
jgi:hypothetical protein